MDAQCTFPSSQDGDRRKRIQNRNPAQEQKTRLFLSQLILSSQQSIPPSPSGSQSPADQTSTPPSPIFDPEHQMSDMLAKISTILSSQAIQDFRKRTQSQTPTAPKPQAQGAEKQQQAEGNCNTHKDQEGDGAKS